MGAMALKPPASRWFTQPFIQAQIKESIKAPHHWPLWGNSPVTGEFPSQRASSVEMFPFDDVIMKSSHVRYGLHIWPIYLSYSYLIHCITYRVILGRVIPGAPVYLLVGSWSTYQRASKQAGQIDGRQDVMEPWLPTDQVPLKGITRHSLDCYAIDKGNQIAMKTQSSWCQLCRRCSATAGDDKLQCHQQRQSWYQATLGFQRRNSGIVNGPFTRCVVAVGWGCPAGSFSSLRASNVQLRCVFFVGWARTKPRVACDLKRHDILMLRT